MTRPMTVSSILNEDIAGTRLRSPHNSPHAIESSPARDDTEDNENLMMRDTTNRWIAALGCEVHQLAELVKDSKCECYKKQVASDESLTHRDLSEVNARLERVDAKLNDLNSAVCDIKGETQLLHRAIGEWLELWREVQAEYVQTLKAT